MSAGSSESARFAAKGRSPSHTGSSARGEGHTLQCRWGAGTSASQRPKPAARCGAQLLTRPDRRPAGLCALCVWSRGSCEGPQVGKDWRESVVLRERETGWPDIGRQRTRTLLDVTFRSYVQNKTFRLRDITTYENKNFQNVTAQPMR
eukprot:6843391-Prymnesium_polylepis.1